jgi:hypothetical protein
MKQPDWQLPALQYWPARQPAAPVALVQLVALEAGVQTSQPLFAVAPAA